MVKYQHDPLSPVFSALADPTRRAILAHLALGETSVGELAEPFAMSLPAVSKHLNVLETAGLIRRERQGRLRRCRLTPARLKEAADWIGDYRRFWEAQLDSLARYLDETRDRPQPTNGGKNDGTDNGKR
jgi:DNA-binding transcriptional ArsR family regulator